MRIPLPIIFVLLLAPLIATAAEPTTTTAPASPKAFVKSWTHDAPGLTLEQALPLIQASGDKEATLAKSAAIVCLAESRLQRAARDKWGKEAEVAVARACFSATEDDNDAATEKIDGDHAVVKFKEDAKIDPLPLVKVDGQWKFDMAKCIQELGNQLQTVEKNMAAAATLFDDSARDLDAGKYKTAADLAGHLQAEMKKLNLAP